MYEDKKFGGKVCYVRHKFLVTPTFVDHTPYYMLANVMMSLFSKMFWGKVHPSPPH